MIKGFHYGGEKGPCPTVPGALTNTGAPGGRRWPGTGAESKVQGFTKCTFRGLTAKIASPEGGSGGV